jgi:hypothetical protein
VSVPSAVGMGVYSPSGPLAPIVALSLFITC